IGSPGSKFGHLKNHTSLTVFDVRGNMITGKIPSIAGLRSLEGVYVNDNGFTSIDAGFFTGLRSLQYVNLGNNPLRPWEIPISLTDATSLQVFSAVNCSLSGEFPDLQWDRMFPLLTVLELSDNGLFGVLPRSFCGSRVQILKLDGQKLNGPISVLQNMTGLTEVLLQGNGFSGPLPDLSGLSLLKVFNVSENQLTGIVPYSFTQLSSLSHVALGNNLLQGPTPKFKTAKADMTGLNSFCLDTPGTPCDPRVSALLSIVESFGGFPAAYAQSWKGNDPCDSKRMGMWLGITCQGSVVVELTQLTELITLDVSENPQLYGTVSGFRPKVVIKFGDPYLETHASSPRNNNAGKIVGSVTGAVVGSLLIGSVVYFFVKKKKMHPQQHSGDKDALKITIGN
ncbi:unnamed protein product, partial [Thlaspi arvense]